MRLQTTQPTAIIIPHEDTSGMSCSSKLAATVHMIRFALSGSMARRQCEDARAHAVQRNWKE